MAGEGIVYMDTAEPNNAVFLEAPSLPFPTFEALWFLDSIDSVTVPQNR